jgi:hypothetical protein
MGCMYSRAEWATRSVTRACSASSRKRCWMCAAGAGASGPGAHGHPRCCHLRRFADVVSDQPTDGRGFRITTVADDCTRECLALARVSEEGADAAHVWRRTDGAAGHREDGALEIAVPRDRNGSSQPMLIGRGQTRIDGSDGQIIANGSRPLASGPFVSRPGSPAMASARARASGSPRTRAPGSVWRS